MITFTLPFPTINPVALAWGPFTIRWYALAYIAGFVFAWWYIRRLIGDDRLWPGVKAPSALDSDDLLAWSVLGVILGGRIGYIIFYNLSYFAAHPLEMFRLWHGGMSFHGGLGGVIIAAGAFAYRRGVAILTVFDLIAASAPVGLFFGRIANFIGGELYGRIGAAPWAMVFPRGGPWPRHPSQLYEAALEGIVLFVVLRVLTHRRGKLAREGFVGGAFAVFYGLARIVAEWFRMPDAQLGYLYGGWLTMGMVLSIPMMVIGAWLMWWGRRRQGRP